jgi:hypothetical protein
MGNSQIVSPVLLESDNTQYKLVYLNFSKDGSIYIFFPRNKGYTIHAQKDIVFPVIGETTFSLENTTDHFDSPYISFHPKNKAIHINDKKKLIFKLDTEVLNFSENKDILSFPMCQIIFPIKYILAVFCLLYLLLSPLSLVHPHPIQAFGRKSMSFPYHRRCIATAW